MIWFLLVGCPDPVESPGSLEADTAGLEDPDPSCASVAIEGGAAGQVELSGAWLEIPAGAVSDATIELCWSEGTEPGLRSRQWHVLPSDLDYALPLQLELEHTGDEVLTQVMVPYIDNASVRSFEATRPGPGLLSAPLYRPGWAWVADDPRELVPYTPSGSENLDMLFVIDNSCSMYEEQVDLSDLFPEILDRMQVSGLDYHLGVISTDMDNSTHSGKLRSAGGVRWIDPNTPNASAVFSTMVQMGTSGSATERGLGAAYTAIEIEGPAYNAGFYREDAQLAIFVLSDEPDQTQSWLITQDEFVDWLNALKPADLSASLSGIVSPAPVGSSYIDVAAQTDGHVTDINNTNWLPLFERVLDDLGSTRMALPAPVVEDTLEAWWIPTGAEPVRIDSTDVLYDADAPDVLVHHGDLPVDEIYLLYALQ